MEQSYYLELCSDPIRFDSVSQITNVFFDDSNKEVCSFNFIFLTNLHIYLTFL